MTKQTEAQRQYDLAEYHLGETQDADLGTDRERYHLAAAQVHATLALAAAQMSPPVQIVREDRP